MFGLHWQFIIHLNWAEDIILQTFFFLLLFFILQAN